MKFEEDKKYKKFGKITGFLLFALIFSIGLTIISRFTKIPDLSYLAAVFATVIILLLGFTFRKILE